ncbi:MAG: aspartate aminotransferase family protein [Monoglobales bacterium]
MLDEIKALDKKYYMNTFGERLNVMFDHGEGMKLYSDAGDVYYDFLGGIAVNSVGHAHPKLVRAISEQAAKVIHTSSLYYIENQARLAQKLVESTCADKAFFCNSGAEANEGAMKLARIYFYKKGMNKNEIISLDHSFHGRTLATVAVTGQEHYQAPYRPNLPGVTQVEPNNFEALKAAVTDKTAAIMLEPIQGESGVHPMDKEYLQKVRELCSEKNIILIFDEVQTGMGRTGHLFAYQLYGIEPDIFTSAKALGGGVPIGAVCAKQFVADAFEPGDHGTTFGGNPLATAAGLAVFDIYESENLVENAKLKGEEFKNKLNMLRDKYPDKISDIRGAGLLIGIQVKDELGKTVFNKLFENKILTSLCSGNTIRIAPPLIITSGDIDLFIKTFEQIIKEI